jgi:hypothetical protein
MAYNFQTEKKTKKLLTEHKIVTQKFHLATLY